MLEWFSALEPLQKIFYYVAIPATVILLVQTILLIIGIGSEAASDAGTEAFSENTDAGPAESYEGDSNGIGGLRLLSVRGIVAFFAVAGWTGIVLLDLQLHPALTVFVSLVCGTLALLGIAKMFQLTNKLQENGAVDKKYAIGGLAEVYLSIPPKRGGKGKISVTIQGRYQEFDAVTAEDEKLPTGEMVRIVDLEGDVFVVEKE